jgi:hypothetical protein
MTLAKLHVVPDDGVRQRLVIGGCAEESAADDVAGVHGDMAWNPRDFTPVVLKVWVQRVAPERSFAMRANRARQEWCSIQNGRVC